MSDPVADALARNDRYLKEFVEAFELCPYAKRCRESGALARRVLLQESSIPEEAISLFAELELAAEVEVALLLFPRLKVAPSEFERFAAGLRPRTSVFHVVAFHPDQPLDVGNPSRLVAFLRRSPDPTLQLVRATTLDRVRGVATGTVFIDSKKIDLHAPLPEPPLSVSERISQANYETVSRVGAERLRELLATMR